MPHVTWDQVPAHGSEASCDCIAHGSPVLSLGSITSTAAFLQLSRHKSLPASGLCASCPVSPHTFSPLACSVTRWVLDTPSERPSLPGPWRLSGPLCGTGSYRAKWVPDCFCPLSHAGPEGLGPQTGMSTGCLSPFLQVHVASRSVGGEAGY